MASILIVDDTPDACEPIRMFLERGGHTVHCACNGREGLKFLLNSMPDAVLLDLMMPEMDGPSFLEVVRSYLRMMTLPVVVHTAMGDSPMIDRVRQLKVGAIMVKGKATLEEIKQELERAMHTLPPA